MKTATAALKLAAPLLLAVALAGCGGSPEPVRKGPEAAAGAPPQLLPLPPVDLGGFAAAVKEQLGAERADLDELVAEPSATDLAPRYGRMGELYHAYGLVEAAAVCYHNAQELDPDSHRWPYLAGVLAETRGDAEVARTLFEQALARRSDDLPALLRLAEAHLNLSDPSAADAIFRRALEVEESSAAAYFGLGRVASARQDPGAAIEHFGRALELQPEAKNVHYLLAAAHRKLGNRDAAERHVALADKPGVTFDDPLMDEVTALVAGVGPHLAAALRAYGAGRWEEAAAEYRAALAIEPENPTALRGLGITYQRAGDLDAAAQALTEMLEIHPDHSLAQLDLATVLLERGSLEEATERFRTVIALDPEFKEAHFNLGVAHSRAGRWAAAAASFERVLELDERHQQARYHLAVAREELGRPDESLALLRQVVAADPAHILARQRLGQRLERAGDLAGARDQHRAVLELDAPSQEQALAHYQLGRIARQMGSLDEALAHFGEARRLFPELLAAGIALGNALRAAGRQSEAAAEYARVVAADPRNLLARLGEADALMRGGDFAAARQRLEDGLRALPRSAELTHLLARLLATAPEAELRDGGRAFELAQKAFSVHQSIEHAETLVMALAEQERFAEAVALQRQLIARAEREGAAEHLGRLRRNLERYLRGEPARFS